MRCGDIVLALYPHASGTPSKRRPALVIQADYYNQKLTNVVRESVNSINATTAEEGKFKGLLAAPRAIGLAAARSMPSSSASVLRLARGGGARGDSAVSRGASAGISGTVCPRGCRVGAAWPKLIRLALNATCFALSGL